MPGRCNKLRIIDPKTGRDILEEHIIDFDYRLQSGSPTSSLFELIQDFNKIPEFIPKYRRPPQIQANTLEDMQNDIAVLKMTVVDVLTAVELTKFALLDEVRNQNLKLEQLEASINNLKANQVATCKVCLENQVEICAIPCGHLICQNCTSNDNTVLTQCYICRSPIKELQRIYFP